MDVSRHSHAEHARARSARAITTTVRCLAAAIALQATLSTYAGPIEDLPVGHWYKVPNSKLRSVAPSPLPAGNSGLESVMNAWSGGAFDTKRNRLIVWGGGHSDYSGNEIYAFDLDDLAWQRLTNPSNSGSGSEGSGKYGDGRPRSTHSYAHLVYAPNVDRFITTGLGSMWSSGARSNYSAAFNFDALSWSDIAARPDVGVPESGANAYDSVTGHIFHAAGWTSTLLEYNPMSNSWATHPDGGGTADMNGYATAAIDPTRRLMVAVGNDAVLAWDLTAPGEKSDPNTTGGASIVGAQAPGLAFDPPTRTFVGWNGGATVYKLDPTTWAWTRVDPAPGNTVIPTSKAQWGTYGRFQYSPTSNVFVVVNSVDQDVYIYRLTPGSGAPVPSSPTALTAR